MLRRRRRARHRPAGRRHPHLHLHLHDGELPGCGAQARRQGDRLRPAESDRRRRRRRADARPRLRVVRRPIPDPDAARDDDRRAGAPVQRALRHRRRSRGRADGRLATRDVSRRAGRAVGDALAEHPDARHRRSCIRARCCSRAPTCRKDAARRGPFELVGAPWVVAERFADDAEPPASCRVFISGPRCSSRPFTSMRARAAAAARFTCSIAAPFRPVLTGVALVAAFRAGRSRRSRWRRAALRVRAREAAVRHPGGIVGAARTDRGG